MVGGMCTAVRVDRVTIREMVVRVFLRREIVAPGFVDS